MGQFTYADALRMHAAMKVEEEANAYLDATYGPSPVRWPVSKTFVDFFKAKFDREPLGRERRPKLAKPRKHKAR